MDRYALSFDGTLPLAASLYDGEEVIAVQDGVGLYDADQKSPDHQLGTVHVTTHRLLYVDVARPRTHSLALSLAHVVQTDYYAGFLKSSPKVTLFLLSSADDAPLHGEGWICQVCSYRNPPALGGDAAHRCGLCGVVRETPPPSSLSAQTLEPTVSQHSIYSGDIASSLASPAIPTPHPTPVDAQDPVACSACTFLNHPSLRNCEMCGTPLPSQQMLLTASQRSFKSAPTSRSETPSASSVSDRDSIKLSFRKGGDKALYAALKRILQGKAWEAKSKRVAPPSSQSNNGTPSLKSGIHGILQNVDEDARAADLTIHSALRDLEALMDKAKDMVELASSLNAKLTAQEEQRARLQALRPELATPSPEEPEEAKFIRSSLSQLGLPTAAVTQDMVKDEKEWEEQLAKELDGVLNGTRNAKGIEQDGIMARRGIVALDEVWGAWNRARGVALIPPETMLLCLAYLPSVTSPAIHLRTFRSGLRVLHTPEYTAAAFTSRLANRIASAGPCSTLEVAREERISPALATEMIEAVEDAGEVVRDAQGGGGGGGGGDVRWEQNLFRDYVWDGT